jgi:transcriptional repressor NrdR
MRCPFCGKTEDRVVDSRESREGQVIRRRRECLSCGRRYTTYERVDEIPFLVLKKDERREPFNRPKLLGGLRKACEKRPVPLAALEQIVDEVETKLTRSPEKEIPSREIGELVMDRLRDLDKVAYVRFASVYREFEDVTDYMKELEGLLGKKSKRRRAPP